MITINKILSSKVTSAIIVLILATLLGLLADKVLKNKNSMAKIIPTILSLILSEVIASVNIKEFVFSVDALYSGLIIGSIATAFISTISKLKKGEKLDVDDLTLLIESFLVGYTDGKKRELTAKAIISVIKDDGDNVIERITDVLKSEQTETEDEITETVNKILQAINRIK